MINIHVLLLIAAVVLKSYKRCEPSNIHINVIVKVSFVYSCLIMGYL